MLAKSILLLLGAAAFVVADLPKANEYTSPDCTGAIHFGHHSGFLYGADVTMDDGSNSVYTNGGDAHTWYAYSGKTGNGGTCTGTNLGRVVTGCHNLNNHAGISPGRIRCLRNKSN